MSAPSRPRAAEPVAGLPSGWRGVLLAPCDRLTHPCPSATDADPWVHFFAALLRDPTSLPGYAVLKYGGGVQVCRATLGDGPGAMAVICKQSRVEGFLRQRLTVFRPTRAELNRRRAAELDGAGIATARPLALLESDRADRESWLITRAIPGVVDLDQVALGLISRLAVARRRAVKAELARTVAGVLARLAAGGLHHRDLKASNILLTHWDGDGGAPEAWLVDLDGLSRCGRGARAKEVQRLVRLAASLEGAASLSRSDRLRFLRAYLAASPAGTRDVKQMWHECQPLVTEYNGRSAGRKSGKIDGYGG